VARERLEAGAAGVVGHVRHGYPEQDMACRPGVSCGMVFESLDYLYTPSRDVAADVRYFTDVLGGRLAFAIEDMGTRVAMVELNDAPRPSS